MAPTNLLLLDDHALFRVTLGRLLGTDSSFRVIGDCSSIPEALSILAGKHVDLVLLDYELGQGETGLQFIRQARGAGYTGRIFIVTAGMTDSECVSALEHGVCGIFLKHSEPDLLIEAIGKVMVGQTWIDSRCIQALVKGLTNDRRNTHPDDLTIRERQVLEGVFGGLSNRQIAAECDISEALVKSVLQKLFVKTGVHTRSQLVRVALEEYGSAWGLRPAGVVAVRQPSRVLSRSPVRPPRA